MEVESIPQSSSPEPESSAAPTSGEPFTPAPRARLAIKSLRLENFKSYGGVVEVGPFHKSFSSIVGPNGSGKSNVIDAMLFVFGRRAKQLRHSKLSELLHNSATHPHVTKACVTVFFHEIIDNEFDDGFTVVENSQIAIARTAFKNNTSKYTLNDREVPMREIVELLKSKGVDLDNNRFLILQGEVEQIAMMKPKAVNQHQDGLLEYLEDIIGSNRHIENIEKSANKVEELNEERGHKLNRVKAAEKERDALQAARDEAMDYLDKEQELLGKKIKLSKADRYQTHLSLKENDEKHKEARAKVDNFNSSVKEIQDRVAVLEKEFKDTKRMSDRAVSTMNAAKDEYSAFERHDIQIRESIKALKAKRKKLATAHTRELKRADESEEKAQQCVAEKEEAESSIEKLETELAKAQKKFDTVRDEVKKKTAPIREKLEKKQEELLPFSNTVNEKTQQLEVAQAELSLLIDKLEAPSRNLGKAWESSKEMDIQLDKACDAFKNLEHEIDEKKRILAEQGLLHESKRMHLEKLTSLSADMRRKVEDARAAREFSSTRSKLHSAILRASRSGRLQGIVGRLGDLATVNSKFSVAVGAAAGASLDCIVVESTENAQAAIQFLRTENLGRATFVILEKVEYLWQHIESFKKSTSTDGPRLFDELNIPNQRNATALYYALRNTLYASSLEEARRMAFRPRKNRVVTLQGELIESTGAMSGGGRGGSRYRLGSGKGSEGEMDPAEFQQLCRDLDDNKIEIQNTEKEMQDIEQNRRVGDKEVEDFHVRLSRAQLEVNSLKERRKYLREETIPKLESEVSKVKQSGKSPEMKRKKELEKTVKTHQSSVEKAKEACEGLEAEIGKLQERIVAAGGSKLQNAKDALENCRTELSELQSSVTKAASRALAAERAAEKARKASVQAEKDMEQTEKDIAKAKEESENLLNDAEVVLKKFKESEDKNEEWLEKVGTAQKEFSKAKDELKQLRREEVSLIEEADALSRALGNDKHKLQALMKKERGLEKKLKRLSLMSVDIPESNNEDQEEMQEEDNDEVEEMDTSEDNLDSGDTLRDFELMRDERRQIEAEVGVLESQVASLSANLDAIGEYKTKDNEYRSQVEQLDGLTNERDAARRECDTLRKQRLDEFMTGFTTITLKLKELYQMITLGGDAELELVDSLDPFSEGILFSVRPPKKSWKNISNLSGGEKTLSSLALVFALHHFKPTPLYFLDEIDAALDFKNVSIVANYIKDRTKNAQFIIISLRNNMFELADRLVGIYKTYNSTKSVTVDPAAFVVAGTQSSSLTVK